MEITSPNSLWKDYDVDALPLNATKLSDKTADGTRVHEYYFDGFTTVDGRARAFVRIHEKEGSKGVVLFLPDNRDDAGKNSVAELLSRNYSVAELNYTGRSDSNPRFTIYPASLEPCNCLGVKKFNAPEDALGSGWFVWACVARRTVRFLVSLYPESRIYAYGRGMGGSIVYKLGAFNDGLTACATSLNIIPDVVGAGNQMINYRAALDNNAYAPLQKVPMMMSVCSNDEDNSLDKMADLAEDTASLKCFRIIERAFSDSIKVVYDQLDRFYCSCAEGDPNIPKISVKPVNSENNLYFNIKITDSNGPYVLKEHERLYFHAAFGTNAPTNRNWTNINILNLGDGEYMANFNVLQDDVPIFVFINLENANDSVVSSQLISVVPKTLGIPAQPAIRRRLIYDGSMGTDVWMSPAGGDVAVKSGPFGIEGVCSDNNTLITFKPGDILYRAEKDALLQIIVSGKCENLDITVSDGSEKYVCTVNLAELGEWNKFTIANTDLKSAAGTLADWSRVIYISFSASDAFLVSSVLWV